MGVVPYQSRLVRAWNFGSQIVPMGLGVKWLSVDKIIDSAIRQAKIDQIEDDSFVEPLSRLTDSINNTGGMHSFGRTYTFFVLSGILANRLKLLEFYKSHPEIKKETIARPIFIVGPPRTGTSFLQNLLAQDPKHRVLTNWEATISQVPPMTNKPLEKDPRRSLGKYMLKFQNHLFPQMKDIHKFYLDGPEECTPLLMQSFTTFALCGMFNVPDYARWLAGASHNESYKHHKTILKTLQWKYPADRWLLKSPAHIEDIKSLLRHYPDACIINTHRDPVKFVPSYASLDCAFQGISYESLDPQKISKHDVELLQRVLRKYISDRDEVSPKRILDIQYQDLVADPQAMIRRIYNHFGLEWGCELESNLDSYVLRQAQRKEKHDYRLEYFGLEADGLRKQFDFYINEFSVETSCKCG